jgi:integrase
MVNRDNYLLVRCYLDYVGQVRQRDPQTVERYRFLLRHLLLWADETSFNKVTHIQPSFAEYLAQPDVAHGRNRLAPPTLKKIIQVSKQFMSWAKLNHPRELRDLPAAWIEDLSPPRSTRGKDEHEHIFVTLDEIVRLVDAQLLAGDLTVQRDQAGAAMLFLSGMRAGALASLPLEAVDLANRSIKQWPALGVRTKNGKSATTYLLDISELIAVVKRWDALIRAQLPSTAMWYTPFVNHWGEYTLSEGPAGASRNGAVSDRMRRLFELADLPVRSAHKFRHGHAVWALQRAQTMADYKAVSMNLMHGDLKVTDGIYAPLLGDEVKTRIASLGRRLIAPLSDGSDVALFLRHLSKGQMVEALHILADEMAR